MGAALAGLLALSIGAAAAAQPVPAPAPAVVQPAPLAAPPLPRLPSPRIDSAHDVDWFFAYKFNSTEYPTTGQLTSCRFGGTPQPDRTGQHYVVARSGLDVLVEGPGLIGAGLDDPLGATFDELYAAPLWFVVWNDQFYLHPPIRGCGTGCNAPWGHSKGMIAWDGAGNGVVLQVTTPSWPGSGSAAVGRRDDGNTLGCVQNNNLKFGQHFFALRLSPADTLAVLGALQNASVVTDIANPQLARIGGPPALQAAAAKLGIRSSSSQLGDVTLSTGVRLISKPSALAVPPWQLVSSVLGGISLRTATWWDRPFIPTTPAGRRIGCWSTGLRPPGRVEIATSGSWQGKRIGLEGGIGNPDHNHGKFGISIDGSKPYVIFGDLNQQGALDTNCRSSQNGRGGLFFVLEDPQLHLSLQQFLTGGTAGTRVPQSGASGAAASTPRTKVRRGSRATGGGHGSQG